MNLSARSAAVRGDDYQYAVGWLRVCDALSDAGIESVSIEDCNGGHFDDVVVRRNDAKPDLYIQVKSSNSGNTIVNEAWLLTPAGPKGKSPLQHFHQTWKTLVEREHPFELKLLTNRGFDNQHPFLGQLRDNLDGRIRTEELHNATGRSAIGKTFNTWIAHLGITADEMLCFLSAVQWEQAGPEPTLREDAKPRMKLAGLRADNQAVEIGISIIRDLVKTGAGPQTPNQLRKIIDNNNLLASTARLILAVHVIDRPTSPDGANVTVDWVDQFPGENAWSRYRPANTEAWTTTFPADLKRARESLEMYRARRVLVTGALRLSTHFAVGNEFADVRRWNLEVDQRGETWTTATSPEAGVKATVLKETTIELGEGLAIAIALTSDPTDDVCEYLRRQQVPISTVVTLGSDGGTGLQAVPSDAWLISWARNAREITARTARSSKADRVHLFMSAPASAALFLGHQWNTVPVPTTTYDFDRQDYFPTFNFI